MQIYISKNHSWTIMFKNELWMTQLIKQNKKADNRIFIPIGYKHIFNHIRYAM